MKLKAEFMNYGDLKRKRHFSRIFGESKNGFIKLELEMKKVIGILIPITP
ncbi:hypothetical protein LEP1GSC185_2583 [Leptospira licerasiae serovar Varillal str. VAR 010]|nr:hypothetical protein LEP1GSC185_2583 [Leptospira licerasiae serovar Varillal str. VAR 010]